MTTAITTDAVVERDRLAYWIDLVCGVYVRLECQVPAHEGFRAHLDRDTLGAIDVTQISCSPHTVARRRTHIAQSSDDFFLLGLQRSGASVVRQGAREAVLRCGDFCLYDSTRPYELLFGEAFDQLILRFPKSLMLERLPGAEDLTATTISGGAGYGALATAMLETLANHFGQLEQRGAGKAANAVLDLLAASFLSLPAAGKAPMSAMVTLYRQQVRDYIHAHLNDPELGVAAVARGVGLSESYLHQLFRDEPVSIARMIWSLRLERCRDALADPLLRHRSLCDIAFNWGFNDAAHFSRAFKVKFGIAPRDFRHAAEQAWSAPQAICGPLPA